MAKKKKDVKKTAWYKRHLKKLRHTRRELYATDPVYRAERLEKSRERYRQSKQMVLMKDCRKNLPDLTKFCEARQFVQNGVLHIGHCFTIAELCGILEVSQQTMRKWLLEGRFPRPTARLKTVADGYVYTEAQVRNLAEVLGQHFLEVSHYRATHVETRDRLFSCVKAPTKKVKK